MIQFITFLNHWVFFIFCLGLPLFLFLFLLFRKHLPSLKILKNLWIFTTCLFLGWAFLLSFSNYYLWKHDPLSRNLLPPFSPLSYLLKYSWLHYFASPVAAIVFSLVIFKGMEWFNKKFQKIFFYDEEPYLASLGILVTGWPNCLIYLCLVLFLGIVTHFIFYLSKGLAGLLSRSYRSPGELGSVLKTERQGEMQRFRVAGARKPRSCETNQPIRLSLLRFWLPCAFLVVLFSGIITKSLPTNQLII